MPVKTITSRDNPDYRSLLALAEDARIRRQQRETLLDGEHLIKEALRAGVQLTRLIVVADTPAEMYRYMPDGLPVLSLPEAMFRKLSPVAAPTGVMAVMPLPVVGPNMGEFVLLLESIQDPGNLGAILRNAAAAGVTDVLLSPGCAEAWSPKALRGGQGGQFRLRVHEGVDLAKWLDAWPGKSYAAALGATHSLYDLELLGRIALVFGNEGQGLSPSLIDRCEAFTIPMAGEIESLNVASSVAITLYERVRQGLQ